MSCQVKLSEIHMATTRLLEWVKANEDIWRTLPTAGPDTVPGGPPAYVNDEVEWLDSRRVGFKGMR